MQSYGYLSNDTMKPIIRSTDREGGREGEGPEWKKEYPVKSEHNGDCHKLQN